MSINSGRTCLILVALVSTGGARAASENRNLHPSAAVRRFTLSEPGMRVRHLGVSGG